MGIKYTKEQIEAMVECAAIKGEPLYTAACVNQSDTIMASTEYTSEVVAAYLLSHPQLIDSGIKHIRRDKTYLLATENKDIAGYFTLSIGFADIIKSVDLSEEDKQKLKMSKCPDHRIPCFLIGQLGRNDSFSHDELPGNQILETALAVLVEVKDQIGGKFVIVECEDHLVSMYQSEQFGFRLFNTPNKRRTYNQLFRLL